MGLPNRTSGQTTTRQRRHKATYSLPVEVISELERRSELLDQPRSEIVAEALSRYFASQDREELAVAYSAAARDPLFVADNEAVARDFALLDEETGRSES